MATDRVSTGAGRGGIGVGSSPPMAPDPAVDVVAERHERLRERMRRAGGAGVELVAVTKGWGPGAVEAAAACGIAHIGENYAQECLATLEAARLDRRPRVHLIGRLQRNKVRRLAAAIDVWQTVDRVELVAEIARRAPGAEVMIQVNVSGESTKGGCAPEGVGALAEAAEDAGLRLAGLMGIGPAGPQAEARPGFRALRRMVDDLGLRHCSMGMSDDLEAAIEEGSTMVRIGRGLFGERPAAGSI